MMPERVYNFSAGPAALSVVVLNELRENVLSLGTTGVGILEHSHRGRAFADILEEAEQLVRDLAAVPDDYHVLFLQGGSSTQFFMVPMNFLSPQATADYFLTGPWAHKALTEARRIGRVNIACDGADSRFTRIPASTNLTRGAAYVHYTSNETICGTQFAEPPSVGEVPLVCDACSDLLTRPIDVRRHRLIYASAQKNFGPAGVTLVIISDDLVQRGAKHLPTMLQYRTHVQHRSTYNTPPVFAIFVIVLYLRWIKRHGGLAGMERRNREKADRLYAQIDQSWKFRGFANTNDRSMMNVTFTAGSRELDDRFVRFAQAAGLHGLKGHRSVGGLRASLYNAVSLEAVEAFMDVLRACERGVKL